MVEYLKFMSEYLIFKKQENRHSLANIYYYIINNYSGTPSLPSPFKGEGREGVKAQKHKGK